MNLSCWKSFNINKEFGSNRLYLMSLLLGILSFILLYIPVSIYHQNHQLVDYGLIPLVITLFLLPMLHKLMHIVPLVFVNKRVRIRWKIKYWGGPTFTYMPYQPLSKKTSIFTALGPTLLLTIPGLISSFVFPSFHAYIVLLTSVNIAFSLSDFICVRQFLIAPKQCIIENGRDSYDILIRK
ncbi:DUF3267 domain-containing protein [Pontibacillus litoralis]|uniref:Zincin peptidase n=1 Tax=Pontibacillus litoralis JSM 072002 TaxID=1385512 RepID=A0A0A5G299_9BACI|nr:DUF3267 domain-containing protein [Pontibacillus litoralis]KGX85273.1 hypothetical protein N784_09540 [Pontibacillus litoralis JSM 072002]